MEESFMKQGSEPDPASARLTSRAAEGVAAPMSTAGLTTSDIAESAISPEEPAIETRELVKRFGKTPALQGLNLRVPRGAVYALLGRNGAGKSTLMQLLLGLLEPSAGSVRVLGLDPIRDGMALRQRIGYIPERLPMYDWMTVEQTVRLVADLHRGWDREEEVRLLNRFKLPRDRKIRELSRGNRALLALALAMAHSPELVLLDECTSGMDPVFRRDFDRSVIDALHESGRTVLFASHQVRELERICDWVGIISEGKMLVESPVEDLRASVKMLRVILQHGSLEDLPIQNILERRRAGREWLITVSDYDPLVDRRCLQAGALVAEVIDLNLEEIFIALLSDEQHLKDEGRRTEDGGRRTEDGGR